MKSLKKTAFIALVALAGLSVHGCSNSGSSGKEASKTIATPLPLVYSNGDVLNYLDPARVEQVEGIKSAGLSAGLLHRAGIGYRGAKEWISGSDAYIAGQKKFFPSVAQLQALYLEKDKFNETVEILKANGLRGRVALWMPFDYWSSERQSVDIIYCVNMENGEKTKSFPELHQNFRAVAELPFESGDPNPTNEDESGSCNGYEFDCGD